VLFERCKEYIVHALEEVCSQPEDPFAGVFVCSIQGSTRLGRAIVMSQTCVL
jgi:hypothetical protein